MLTLPSGVSAPAAEAGIFAAPRGGLVVASDSWRGILSERTLIV